jgi:DNA-directed RNA polymerase specialized sigma24 family protein
MMTGEGRDPLEELIRLQVLNLRRSLETQSEAIIELNKAGFGNTRIAELLGTTAPTVKMALHRAKNRAAKESPKGAD